MNKWIIGIGIALALILSYFILQNKTDTNTNIIKKNNMTKARLKTNKGDIVIEFRNDKPLTVSKIKDLIENGTYNGTRFHRIIKDFMIQGGDPLSKDKSNVNMWGTGGPGYKFNDEFAAGDSLTRGVVAMANSGPNTNGSQFFIITAASTPWLVGHHTPFAMVITGMDIVETIQNVQTGPGDRPVEDVIVESVTLE